MGGDSKTIFKDRLVSANNQNGFYRLNPFSVSKTEPNELFEKKSETDTIETGKNPPDHGRRTVAVRVPRVNSAILKITFLAPRSNKSSFPQRKYTKTHFRPKGLKIN